MYIKILYIYEYIISLQISLLIYHKVLKCLVCVFLLCNSVRLLEFISARHVVYRPVLEKNQCLRKFC